MLGGCEYGGGDDEMTRRCSNCSNNGHNARTCPARAGGVRLFGVRLTEGVGPMKKSASMSCLSSSCSAGAAGTGESGDGEGGYASDDPARSSCSMNCRNERKKGTPWTEEEHRMFLLGLQKLGKGDWRGIARNFVVSRTSTQVASHAQKYFIRQTSAVRRKRRSSLFDMAPEMPMCHIPVLEEQFLLNSPPSMAKSSYQLPSLHLSQDKGSGFAPSPPGNHPLVQNENIPYNNKPVQMVPAAFCPAFVPVPLHFWPPNLATPAKEKETEETNHEILKPIPVILKEPGDVDQVVGMSNLRIGECASSCMKPSALSLKLLGSATSRQSAFHQNPSATRSDLSKSNSNAIHAV
ncbi:transcription factor MYBS3-like [Typha angustifolia]|uniref:transcription factor MYBS3-like n=1 Tax=Typha angustifolia TaxID=59011 RepID=UPI003C2BFF84